MQALKRYSRIVLTAVLSIAFLIFAVDNREVAHVSLFPLPYHADLPLFLFAIFVFFLGAVGGYLCTGGKSRKLAAQLKAEQLKAMGLQNQIESIRAERLPITPPAVVSTPVLPL